MLRARECGLCPTPIRELVHDRFERFGAHLRIIDGQISLLVQLAHHGSAHHTRTVTRAMPATATMMSSAPAPAERQQAGRWGEGEANEEDGGGEKGAESVCAECQCQFACCRGNIKGL